MKKIINNLSLHSDNNLIRQELCKVNAQINNGRKTMIVNGQIVNPIEYVLALEQGIQNNTSNNYRIPPLSEDGADKIFYFKHMPVLKRNLN